MPLPQLTTCITDDEVGGGNVNFRAHQMWQSGDHVSLDANYFTNSLGGFGQYYCTAMQQAMDSGQPYQTRLDPPPADPSVAHEGEPPEWVEVPSTNAGRNARMTSPKSVAVPGTPKSTTASPSAPAPVSQSSPEPKASMPEAKRAERPPIPVMPPPQGTYTEKFSRIMALKRDGTSEAIGEIVAALGDEDDKVRWLASSTLTSLKDEWVATTVRAFAERTTSAAGQEAAEQVLTTLGWDGAWLKGAWVHWKHRTYDCTEASVTLHFTGWQW